MDRNRLHCLSGLPAQVALRKESVDRNCVSVAHAFALSGSLSARRAWIEIRICKKQSGVKTVALRKESVDRNISLAGLIGVDARSLSARRAWIEIPRNEKNRNNKERG